MRCRRMLLRMNEEEPFELSVVPPSYTDEGEGGMDEVFAHMARKHAKRISLPRTAEFSRKQVVNAFKDTFELIGGVPRLATWAHLNPSKFYQLYAKLLPNQQILDFGNDGVLKIMHALAPGPLDGPRPIIEGEIVDV